MKIKEFPSLDSTNTWAKKHINELDPTCMNVILAEEQTGGRGQFDRKWLSTKGKGLYVTYAFITEGGEALKQLPLKFASVIVDLLKVYGIQARIKEPNDIFVGEKKIAGILTEAREPWCFVGIGLNLSYTKEELEVLDQPATSVFIETSKSPKAQEIEKALRTQLA